MRITGNVIEISDLPAIVGEVLDELSTGAEPFSITEHGKVIAVMHGVHEGHWITEERRGWP